MSCCSIFKELPLCTRTALLVYQITGRLSRLFFIFFQVFFALPFLSPPAVSVSYIIQALSPLVNSIIDFLNFSFFRYAYSEEPAFISQPPHCRRLRGDCCQYSYSLICIRFTPMLRRVPCRMQPRRHPARHYI